MRHHYIESFKINELWGYRKEIEISFNRDVNILIGPNGSGKTTILNLMHSILSADVRGILSSKFKRIEIKLKGFKTRSEKQISIEVSDRSLIFGINDKEYRIRIIDTTSGRRIPEDMISSEKSSTVWERVPRSYERVRRLPGELHDELTSLVPLVWLPVSRRVPPTSENEEDRYTRKGLLESVDVRLHVLLEGLFHYHSRLNTQLSDRYSDFERQALSVMLYSKEHDKISTITYSLPTESEKKQLIGAFDAAGLLNEQMQSRIEEHFAAAEKVNKRISENDTLSFEDYLVIPLMSRTKSMVEYAGKLEKYRTEIFAPIRLYEDTVSSYLEDKTIVIDKDGNLKIMLSSKSELNWPSLSSGEKQILIMFTQALLRYNHPVVYVTDEPELSLHVTWQVKLLESLVKIGGQKQIIVATHSPDIVGDFRDKVIDLGRLS